MTTDSHKRISVVIPAYNEEANISELAQRLGAVFDAEPAYEFEAILVENGSEDRTFERALKAREVDPRIKVLQLSRNFRMDGGLTAGLNHASGDAAVLMAADLQDPPELIHQFLRRWEDGYEIVYQIVTDRQGTGPIRRMNSQLFYWVAGRLTDGRIPRNVSDFRLVDRKVYETVNVMEERNRFVRGLFAWVGFSSTGIEHERPPRTGGVSGAHTFGVIDLALKGLFAHSYKPLKLISIFGLVLSAALVPRDHRLRDPLLRLRRAIRRLRHDRVPLPADVRLPLHDARRRERVRRTHLRRGQATAELRGAPAGWP